MKKMSALKKFVLLALVMVVMVSYSCDDDKDDVIIVEEGSLNIVETAIATADLSNLVAALKAADGDLVTVLNGTGPFTVLAPTNAAFSAFLADNNFASLADVPTDVLSQILLNHVITGTVKSTNLTAAVAGYAKTNAIGAGNNTMSLYFDTSNGVRFNNISSVSTADVMASNGIVHIVDAVIGLPSVVDHALANSNFSNLVASLQAADGDLVSVLSGAGPFTVLAPDNTAFGNFLSDNGFAGLGDVPTDVLSQVLLNHVLGATVLSTDLVSAGAGYSNTSATGAGGNAMSIYFDTSDGVTFNGISSVTTADVVGTNGIIHAVDAVIGLPTVVDFALADPTFGTLVTALTRSDLTFDYVTTLQGEGPFTVFAPTNTAFGDLLTELGAGSLADIDEPTLKATLNHHAVAGANVRSNVLTDNMPVGTLGGEITANVTGGATLTDANGRVSKIIAVDVQAVNGVIHAIDKVVLPQLQ